MTLMDCLEKSAGMILPCNDSEYDWNLLPRTEIVIRRECLLEDAIKEGQKKRFNPKKYLKVSERRLNTVFKIKSLLKTIVLQVSFVGEEGIDTGGPSREFWRLFMHDVERKYFIGSEGKLTLLRNMPALEVSLQVYI